MIREWSCDSPADMAQLELLQAEHVGARPAREPVRGGAAEAAEAQDDVFVVVLHAGGWGGSADSSGVSPSRSPT